MTIGLMSLGHTRILISDSHKNNRYWSDYPEKKMAAWWYVEIFFVGPSLHVKGLLLLPNSVPQSLSPNHGSILESCFCFTKQLSEICMCVMCFLNAIPNSPPFPSFFVSSEFWNRKWSSCIQNALNALDFDAETTSNWPRWLLGNNPAW